MTRSLTVGAGVCVIALCVTSCAADGIYAIPLPGGADIGNNPMHLTVQFEDVLDLVPQSAVKVDGVPVGRVESIGLDGWIADVGIVVDSAVDLPANAVASIQQSNLLGEKFIELGAPEEGAQTTRLGDGDIIALERTRHATEVEQVLGALSLLLGGGGVAQLQPIIHELTKVFEGREDKVRGLLEQADTLIDGLNRQRDDITRALDGLDELNYRVGRQTDQITRVLEEIPSGVRVLEEQRPQFVALLRQLDRLGRVGTDVLMRSKDDLIADLRALRPTLQALADSSGDLVTVLPLITTFPFPDGVEKVIHGNSLNLFLSLDLQLGEQLTALGVGLPDPVYLPPKYGGHVPNVDPSNPYYKGNGPRRGWPTVSLLPMPPIAPAPGRGPGPPQAPFQGLLDQLGVGGQLGNGGP